MKAIILAGGLGTRLKPFTSVIPKPLLPVGEKSVLEIQIDRLRKFGFDEIILTTNYKSDYIEKFFGDGSRYGVRLSVSREDVPLGTAGPLSLLRDRLAEPFILMNGDILTLADFGKLYAFGLSADSLLTIAIKKEILPFAFGNIFFSGDRVTGIQEKPEIITWIIAGIYVMKPGILDLIPDGTYFGMDALIRTMLEREMPVMKYELAEYWLDIGRVSDYERAHEIVKTHFEEP
ncbi:MAG: sugar phosphate nucleotidyltransferase [bacterium]|nr:sugar phosphate nucleotidyltransferase [bacterium]